MKTLLCSRLSRQPANVVSRELKHCAISQMTRSIGPQNA
ncbi:hypothetical protein SynA1544_02628 [Synechococcus sp. A15-44]|nr:hypothetical protein SynA1544_02628 [Synechococcus sp. A15-44]